jgi:hypothetical protein
MVVIFHGESKMTVQTYQHLIIEGIKGLPEETLAEIANFVFFVRKRILYPQAFEDELRNALLEAELRQLSRNEEAHLEQEFEGYDQLYPHE